MPYSNLSRSQWSILSPLLVGVCCIHLALSLSVFAQPKWEKMDYGSFLSSSVTMPWSVGGEDTSGITLKGITVDLGESASICFDTDLLRYAGGWTGGWLKLMGTPSGRIPPRRCRQSELYDGKWPRLE